MNPPTTTMHENIFIKDDALSSCWGHHLVLQSFKDEAMRSFWEHQGLATWSVATANIGRLRTIHKIEQKAITEATFRTQDSQFHQKFIEKLQDPDNERCLTEEGGWHEPP